MKSLIAKEKLHRLVQTAVLGAAMLGLLLWSGWQILGATGLVFFGAGGLLMFAFLSRRSPAATLAQGIPIPYAQAPELHQTVRAISRRAGLAQIPSLYYLPSPFLNAVTIGTQEDSAILLTQGLISRLTLRELAGVLAHEISHIRNNDLRVFSFANYLRQATTFISRFGWVLLFLSLPVLLFSGTAVSFGAVVALIAAPLLSYLLQLALLRTREFSADVGAVELTGDPLGLASALNSIQNPARSIFDMFFPVRKPEEGSSLFRTHPATEERIRRLNELTRADRARRRGSGRSHGFPPRGGRNDGGREHDGSDRDRGEGDDSLDREGGRRANIYFDEVPESAPDWFRKR